MKPTLKAFLFITALTLIACNKTTPIDEIEGFDYGKVTNDHYINKYFDIEMNIPKGWAIQDENAKRKLMEEGSEIVFKDEATAKAAIKTSEITTANLFTAFANNPGTTGFNHNLIIFAENVSKYPNIRTGDAYLENLNKVLRNSKLEIIQIDNSFPKRSLNGKDYYEMNIVAHVNNIDVHQTYLMTIDKGFAFGFVYAYVSDGQKAEIEKYVNSLTSLTKSRSVK